MELYFEFESKLKITDDTIPNFESPSSLYFIHQDGTEFHLDWFETQWSYDILENNHFKIHGTCRDLNYEWMEEINDFNEDRLTFNYINSSNFIDFTYGCYTDEELEIPISVKKLVLRFKSGEELELTHYIRE